MKFLCLGDIHLGRTPSRLPAGLGDPRPAQAIGPAAAFRRCVDYALDHDIRALLLAGDVIDDKDDFYEACGELRRGIERLAKAKVPIVAVNGNHDGQTLPRLFDALALESGSTDPDACGFYLLGRGGKWEALTIEDESGAAVHLLGWSFPSVRVRTSPLDSLLPPKLRPPGLEDRRGPVIGLLHCDRDAPASPWAPVRSRDLAAAPVDAWLLGHIHKADALTPPRPMGYLGSLTGLDPGETGPHGPWLLECKRLSLDIEHLPLAPLRWEELTIDLEGIEDYEEVQARIVAAVSRRHRAILAGHPSPSEGVRRARHDDPEAGCPPPLAVGCRLRFTGRISGRGAIERRLEAENPIERFDIEQEGIRYFVHDWRLETRPPIDLELLAQGSDPPALLARRLLALRSDGANPQDEALRKTLIDGYRRRLASRSSGPFLKFGHSPPDDETVVGLLQEAAFSALDALQAQREGQDEEGRGS
ncbi:MAG: metallophosphoesterase [Ectothiorhodospiraceae bacterium AqS1]|nr:metallophosphoesterase [Ectothiorhodospiraceae bacterium AqS1]